MRASLGLAGAVLLAVACRTPPEVVPERPNEPQTRAAPLSLTKLAPSAQELFGATLMLDGEVAPSVQARELTWTARRGETVVGSGTVSLELGADRTFSAELPVSWGETAADLEPLQELSTMNVVVETKLGQETATRSIQVRAPKLPEAKMVTVQASRTGPQAIGVTFLVALRNPNLFDVRFSSLKYAASMAGKEVGKGTIPAGIRIPPTAETQYEIPVEANPENCGKEIGSIIKLTEMPWTFTGTARYGNLELPVELGGDLKVSKE